MSHSLAQFPPLPVCTEKFQLAAVAELGTVGNVSGSTETATAAAAMPVGLPMMFDALGTAKNVGEKMVTMAAAVSAIIWTIHTLFISPLLCERCH